MNMELRTFIFSLPGVRRLFLLLIGTACVAISPQRSSAAVFDYGHPTAPAFLSRHSVPTTWKLDAVRLASRLPGGAGLQAAASASPTEPTAPGKASNKLMLQAVPDRAFGYLLTSFGSLAAAVVLALSWVGLLCRRMAMQMKRIEERGEEQGVPVPAYQKLLENANDIIYRHDLAGNFQLWSTGGERLLGYTPTEATKLNLERILPPEQADKARQLVDRHLAAGGRATYELPAVAKDGRKLTLEINSWLVYEGRQPVGVEGIARDITARRRAEPPLQQTEHQYRSLIDGAREGLIIHQDALIQYANAAAARIFGYADPDELIGQNVWETLVVAEDRAALQARADACLREQPKSGSQDWQAVRKDGTCLWVNSSDSTVNWQGQQAILTFFTDVTDRRQAEEALAKERDLLNNLLDNVPDRIYLKDRQSRFLRASRALTSRLGLNDASGIVGKTDFDFRPPDEAQEFYNDEQQVMASGVPLLNKTGQQTGPDGSVSWVSISKVPIWNALGQVVGLIGIAHDITEFKRAETALRASEELNRTLLTSLPQRVFFKDRNSVFQRVNAAFAADLGLPPEKVLGKSDYDFFPKELAEKYVADDQKVMAARQPVYLEERNVIQGNERIVEVVKAPVIDDRGELIGLLGLFTDITERKRAVEESQRMEAFLNSVVENLPLMVFIKDAKDLHFVLWNKAGEEMIGHTSEELVGKTDYDIFPKEAADVFTAKDREILQLGKLQEVPEEKVSTRDKGERILRTTKIPIFDEQGRPQYLLGISEDITERKRTEMEMENLHKRLLDASRQAGMAEVATGVLHNIGNILNSINVSTTLVSDRLRRSEIPNLVKVSAMLEEHKAELGQYITAHPKGKLIPRSLGALASQLVEEQSFLVQEMNSLRQNVDHAKDIVATQQDYAKLSGVVETLPVATLVEDALRMNTGALLRHNIKVVREFETVPNIAVEKHKVLQILINLIRNAKYALDEGGRPEKRLTLRISPTNDKGVKVEVTDNGIGIPAENLTRIFAHGFTTRKDGHGFGLHSGALAAKEIGGSLTAASAGVGHGATFTLELPLSPKEILHHVS